MTYNIRTYDGPDSIWDGITGDYEGWEGRDVTYALATIIELGPDVVGLQEDDSNLYAEYSKVSGLADYARITDSGNGNEGNEILYNTKAGVSLVGNKTGVVYYKELAKLYASNSDVAAADFSKDDKGDNEVGRFFRWAILEKNGVQFLVVNTHLHYKASDTSESSDPINKNLRKAQATLLRLWLNESAEASECANRIVIGDMNAQGDSKEMAGFTSGTGALNMARNDATLKVDVGGTLIGDSFTNRQPWVYDHILYSADTLTAVEYSVVDNYDPDPAPTGYPSDHLPVVAKFSCKAS